MSDSSPPTYDSSAPFSSLASMPGRSEQLSLRETSSNEGAPLSHRETNSSMYQETLHEYWPGSEGNTLDYGTRGRIIRGAEMRSTGSDNGDIAYFGALALKEAKEKAEKKRLKALGTPKSEIDSLVRGPAINSSKYLLPGFGLTEERFRRIIEDANSVLSSIRPQDRANGKNGVSIMVDAFARELVARGKGDLTLIEDGDSSKSPSIRFTLEGKAQVKKVEELMRGQFSIERVDEREKREELIRKESY